MTTLPALCSLYAVVLPHHTGASARGFLVLLYGRQWDEIHYPLRYDAVGPGYSEMLP